MKKALSYFSAILLVISSSGILTVAPALAKQKENHAAFATLASNNGRGNVKVTLCHLAHEDDGTEQHTITVATPAVNAHLAHGDTLGACTQQDDNEDEHDDDNETAPVITNVTAASITATNAVITWTTNEPGTSQVTYAAFTAGEWISQKTAGDAALVTAHSVTLTGLSASTTYRFRVTSKDADGHKASSRYLTFTTLPVATQDTTAPVISGVNATSTTLTSTVINWTTNEAANGVVEYAAGPLASTTPVLTVSSATLATAHSLSLTGLTADTTYHYRVKSTDAAGNTATSAELTFATRAVPDTTAPVISGVIATSTTSVSSRIQWTTNEPASSVVEYAAGPLTTTTPLFTASNSTLVTAHGLLLTGLTASTTYHFRVKSTDAAGNIATSAEMTFHTPVAPDTTAPVISGISATSTTPTSAVIGWTTNEPGTSRVTFATVTLGSATVVWSIMSNALVSAHSVLINGLTAATKYFFTVASTDSDGNTATSLEQTFTTLP
ncbi:MAG: fibronectin type III domain-containing protein [Patescibacteria group bacterium]|nr:fibronectin type III domain-containing protein [Patescibacteria group bacterium]